MTPSHTTNNRADCCAANLELSGKHRLCFCAGTSTNCENLVGCKFGMTGFSLRLTPTQRSKVRADSTREMFPLFTPDDEANGYLIDSECVGKITLQEQSRGVPLPNLYDLRFGQLAAAMVFSAYAWCSAFVATALSSLADAILSICDAVSEKQMIRSYARRIVACMADHTARWWLSIVNLPQKTIRSNRASANRENSVTVFVSATAPFPASIGLVDKRPKPIKHVTIHAKDVIRYITCRKDEGERYNGGGNPLYVSEVYAWRSMMHELSRGMTT